MMAKASLGFMIVRVLWCLVPSFEWSHSNTVPLFRRTVDMFISFSFL